MVEIGTLRTYGTLFLGVSVFFIFVRGSGAADFLPTETGVCGFLPQKLGGHHSFGGGRNSNRSPTRQFSTVQLRARTSISSLVMLLLQ